MIRFLHHKTQWVFPILLWLPTAALAEVRVPGFFNHHMVLQRDMPVPVWGRADPGEMVKVSFAGQEHETRTGDDGTWMVKLNPLKASAEGRLLTAGETRIEDVVVGEVWICSGQSNMQFRVDKALNAEQEIAAADYPGIRQLNMNRTAAYLPNTDADGEWSVCSPGTAGKYTAVGYYFARKLYKELKIPIGLIDASWGGTGVEPWIPEAGYRMIPELNKQLEELEFGLPASPAGKEKWERYLDGIEQWLPGAGRQVARGKLPVNIPARPGRLPATHHGLTKIYNAVINPLIPYAIRGTIWYQGESSWGHGPHYFYLKQGLIEGWRARWNQPPASARTMPGRDFSFYTVQLANLHPYNQKPEGGDGYARIREAQRRCLELSNTGLAVTYDIGNPTDIHPKNKQDVGLRLALWALAKDYGKEVVYSGPLFERIEIKGNEAHIHFTCTGSGLMAGNKDGPGAAQAVQTKLEGFAVAGSDKKWHWAEAKITPDGKSLIVTSAQVSEPAAVRYAYRWNPFHSNLYNKEGLPAAPFRTDDW
ncbi:MAG: sialate O-acetylesterase [Planctomycetota bacterium]|jgi:sialate O-acetylesterase|nr:sialate O-acetylesterase [Chloroflexota bacterium]MDP6119310.1 sialate O-acetylesterase [Planctomycetota bacterium]|tara:strand:- start:2753 stop:4357 length:1605 start_codon:yes stop_codon:yes gene_type:complete